jgi:alpha-L-fucosidase
MKLGYGMFLHFGPNALQGVGLGDGKFPAQAVDFPRLNVRQWAEMAAEAGMKYAVLTSKHVDGFCLWPSQHTSYSVKNSRLRKDVAGLFVEEFRRAGLKVGFYYALWDRNFPDYEKDAVYADYVRQQVRELLTQYGDILQLWFDGAWDKDFPTRDWPYDPAWEKDPKSGLGHGERWEWKRLYQHIHNLQPNCLVLNNSSSDRPGQVRYLPVDARTAEHFDFIHQGKLHPARLDPVFEEPDGKKIFLPLEYCTSVNPSWFNTGKPYSHPSVETIVGWHRTARASNSNLLLNFGPDAEGLLPEYHRPFLKAAAKRLRQG